MFDYYRDFNFKNIKSQKFRHLFYILFWPVYLTLFVLTEKYITPIYDVYCPLDDLIPFCEFFVVPYFLWYGLLAFVSLYGLFYDVDTFKKFYKFLCISSAISFVLFIIFPNQQNLRPDSFVRDNVFVDIMKNGIYVADTNTNVCPSLHVVFSVGMLCSLWNSRHFSSAAWRTVSVVITVMVCISTVFLKQHSVIDIAAGIAVCAVVFPFVFLNKRDKNKFFKKE